MKTFADAVRVMAREPNEATPESDAAIKNDLLGRYREIADEIFESREFKSLCVDTKNRVVRGQLRTLDEIIWVVFMRALIIGIEMEKP